MFLTYNILCLVVIEMECPYCQHPETKVTDSRDTGTYAIRRRRECLKCNKRFTTYEYVEMTPVYIVKKDGSVTNSRFAKKQAVKPCSFERIYFSRGTDKDIYKERKKLGAYLAPTILEEINYDFDNTVFSFIPNTASVAFQGLLDEVRDFNANMIQEQIIKSKSNISKKHLQKLFSNKPRVEAIAVKDVKLRTFITADKQRDDLVASMFTLPYFASPSNL